MNNSTQASLQALLPWLLNGGEVPEIPIQLAQETWLAPLCFVRLGERQDPLRAQLNAAFSESFMRRAKLETFWRESLAALARAGIEVITLGSLPFAEAIYPHVGARYSQDVDLLVRPQDTPRAEAALGHIGWLRNPRLRLLERDDIQLDLHTTPGEEARAPVLAEVFGHSTEVLFASAQPCAAGGWELPIEVLLDNRVLHFFKHACEKPLHGLEIALLLRQQYDAQRLARVIEASRSRAIWEFVLAVLARWGLADAVAPIGQEAAVERAANLALGTGVYKLIAAQMSRGQRARYAWQLFWLPREELLKTYGVAQAGIAKRAYLRALRARKFLNALLT